MLRWLCFWMVCFCLRGAQVCAEEPTKEQLYLRALEQYQKKQYKEASATLEALLKILGKEQQKQEKGTRAWHMMTLGRADALHYLADATWKIDDKRQACKRLSAQALLLKSLPERWEKWPLQPSLLERVRASRGRFQGGCERLPSELIFQLSPAHAKVSFQNKEGVWFPLQGNRLQTLQRRVRIKVTATEHHSVELERTIPRWQRVVWPVTLRRAEPKRVIPPRKIVRRKAPLRRVAVITRPIKPVVQAKPFYQSWWFWTITGVVVAGAVATTVVVVVTHEPRYVFKGEAPNPSYKVW